MKSLKFGLFPQYLLQKWTKKLYLEVVLCVILTLLLGKNFNMCIVNIMRFYASKNNKVSIIIWQSTVIMIIIKNVINCLAGEFNCFH